MMHVYMTVSIGLNDNLVSQLGLDTFSLFLTLEESSS